MINIKDAEKARDDDVWIDAFRIPEMLYRSWMRRRKNRRKARHKRKLQRMKNALDCVEKVLDCVEKDGDQDG